MPLPHYYFFNELKFKRIKRIKKILEKITEKNSKN
jgi:hypothetical protein